MLNPQFGTGVLFGVPNYGNLATNPTPMQFGILQEVQVEFKADLKKLYGQQQGALAKARGKIDVTAKGKIASLDPMFYSQLYFGQPTTTGLARPVFNEPHVAAADVTPTSPTANKDLGVINAATGVQLTLVPSAPATGQYSFTPAVAGSPGTSAEYVFSAADIAANLAVLISYVWPDTTHGTTLHVANQLTGYAPEFQALLYNDFRGSLFGLLLYSCTMGSLSVPTKQEDFWISDFDFDASCDSTGNWLDIFADQL